MRADVLPIRDGPTGSVQDADTGATIGDMVQMLAVAFVLGGSRSPVDVWVASALALDLLLDLSAVIRRLVLDVGRSTAVLDGTPYTLTQPQLRAVRLLCERPSHWVSSTDIKTRDGQRVDRWIKGLPEPLRRLINSKTGAGYELKLAEEQVAIVPPSHGSVPPDPDR